eukprot:scaffold8424_cov114-Phaeocystis_antarctica.AAC.3
MWIAPGGTGGVGGGALSRLRRRPPFVRVAMPVASQLFGITTSGVRYYWSGESNQQRHPHTDATRATFFLFPLFTL